MRAIGQDHSGARRRGGVELHDRGPFSADSGSVLVAQLRVRRQRTFSSPTVIAGRLCCFQLRRAQPPGASPVCASAYFLTAAMVRRFSLSKLLRMSLRRGRVMAGMEISRTSQRVTSVLAVSGSNE
jgi:hypothetical protein